MNRLKLININSALKIDGKKKYYLPIVQILICAVLISLVSSCKKEPGKSYIKQEVKDWFFIDTGSYYVYKVNNTYLDSIRFDNIEHFFPKPRVNDHYIQERYNISAGDLRISIDGVIHLGNMLETPRNVLYHPSMNIESDTNLDFGVSGGPNKCIYQGKIQNYRIGGNDFGLTLKWKMYKDYFLQSDSSEYYFSKGIGITRIIDYANGLDKKLIRYKIKKRPNIE